MNPTVQSSGESASAANTSDASTPVAQLRDLMRHFVAERDWWQFHDAKNLSMSIAIEAAELMEHFQWIRSENLPEVKQDAQQMARIGEEVADVLCYLMALANAMDLDLSTLVRDKMIKNAAKYPADRFKGRYR